MPRELTAPEQRAFEHAAFLYSDDERYLDAAVRHVREGLESDEPVLVAVPTERIGMIAGELGTDTARVTFVDIAQRGANPARLIPTVRAEFLEPHRGRRTRIWGEPVYAQRKPDELNAAIRHEALMNREFADYPTYAVCPYDTVRLSPGVIAFATRTHPSTMVDGERLTNDAYTEPEGIFEALNDPIPDASDVDLELPLTVESLAEAADRVAFGASAGGLPIGRARDLRQAVMEIAQNTLAAYLPEPGLLRMNNAADRVVVEIRLPHDAAAFLDGRIIPESGSERARALAAANELVDLVDYHTQTLGTSTTLYMWR